ncbi:MAG: Gfo/Idh/MocA family oxidoreductase, partial [Candidatus Eisenbacteria bacterium]|nr:Gfo/Idh/MocA family oxidoreductase [Candidatus Eisenbacteria bacterium]
MAAGPVDVAVVGCGHLGTFHARTWSRNPRARLVAVADVVEERARRLGEELGCATVISHRDLPPGVRAASVAVPTSAHAEVSIDLLRAGVDVLVEKPLAADPVDGAEMVRAARESGRVLAVGQIERCNPAFREARERLGRPRFIESHRLATFVPRSLDVDVVLDLMIHDIDLVLSVAGSPLERIDAVGVPVITGGADIANARLVFSDGLVANLTASRVSGSRLRKIRFFAPNLYLSVDLGERRVEEVRLERIDRSDPPPAAGTPEEAILAARGMRLVRGSLPPLEGDALRSEIESF